TMDYQGDTGDRRVASHMGHPIPNALLAPHITAPLPLFLGLLDSDLLGAYLLIARWTYLGLSTYGTSLGLIKGDSTGIGISRRLVSLYLMAFIADAPFSLHQFAPCLKSLLGFRSSFGVLFCTLPGHPLSCYYSDILAGAPLKWDTALIRHQYHSILPVCMEDPVGRTVIAINSAISLETLYIVSILLTTYFVNCTLTIDWSPIEMDGGNLISTPFMGFTLYIHILLSEFVRTFHLPTLTPSLHSPSEIARLYSPAALATWWVAQSYRIDR
ncbi:hypothetical protein G9A89_000352, partial [Geosiphon pyriformis]